jgi:uncharacterized lipoprotein YmbA
MGTRWMGWLGVGLLVFSVAGCGSSAPSRFYTLSSVAAPAQAKASALGVIVGPVSVPAAVDRPEFVVQVTPNRVDVSEFDRWAAPLSNEIARTVAGDLSLLLGTPDVGVAPFANFDPDYRVTINVLRFESMPGDSVHVEAVWAVRKTEGGVTSSGRTSAQEAVDGKDFEGLAAAHSRALVTLSSDIADAIRAVSGDR